MRKRLPRGNTWRCGDGWDGLEEEEEEEGIKKGHPQGGQGYSLPWAVAMSLLVGIVNKDVVV